MTPEKKCATLYSCFWLVGRHQQGVAQTIMWFFLYMIVHIVVCLHVVLIVILSVYDSSHICLFTSFVVVVYMLFYVAPGHHFGGLLDSTAANAVVEQKIDAALAGPEGKFDNSITRSSFSW